MHAVKIPLVLGPGAGGGGNIGGVENNYLEAMGFMARWQDTMDLLSADQVVCLPSDGAGLSGAGGAGGGGFEHVLVYADPSGASLCVFKPVSGGPDESFAVSGPALVDAEVWQPAPGIAVADVLGDEGELEARILVCVDDPHMYPAYELAEVGPGALVKDFCVGAVAVDVQVFETVEAWRAQQSPVDAPGLAKQGVAEQVFVGPSFVASPWLFAMFSGEAGPEDLSAISMVKAVCEEVEVVTNRLTGKQWYRVVADCGIPVNLALPIDTVPVPQPGSVVDGKAFLTGTTGVWRE